MTAWRPLKQFCRSLGEYGLNITADRYRSSGVRLIRTTDITEDGHLTGDDSAVFVDSVDATGLLLEPGDLLFSRSGTLGRCLRFDGEPRTATFAAYLVRFRLQPQYDPRYLAYCAEAKFFREVIQADATQSTIANFNAERYANLRVPWQPPSSQSLIADYLDAETARIDALMAKKRRMVELLAERTRASAIHTVLGDDGDLASRESRSGLYRSVPKRWSETTLRHLNCDVQTGPFGSQLHASDYVYDGWPVVNPTNLAGGRIIRHDGMTVSEGKRNELARHILTVGDIVFGRRGEMGRAGLVEAEHQGWLCGTGSLRLRLHHSAISAEYLKLLLETPPVKGYFEFASVGSTMDNLNSGIVMSLPVLVPPLADQIEIVERVRSSAMVGIQAVSKLSCQIDLIREHRQALITSAVSGEIDLSGIAA